MQGTTGEFKAMWDDTHFYLLAVVKDQVLNDAAALTVAHEQDSIELFLDENNAKTSQYDPDDGQYRISFANTQTINGGRDLDLSCMTSAAKVTDDGYIVELRVAFAGDYHESGVIMGYDIQINNADDSGSRTGTANWSNELNDGWNRTDHYGLIKLVETME